MYEFKPVSDRVKKMHQRVRDRIIQIDAERATIITESSKKYEAVTPIIKRPLVTHDVCSQMTVLVDDEDRFVGNRGAHFCGAGVNPEWAGGGWIPGVIKKGQWKLEEDGMYHSSKEEDTKCCITKEDYEKLAEIDEYWKTRRISATANAWQPEGFKEFCELGASSYTPGQDIMGLPLGHLTPGYQKIINVGYGAIRKQARDWIEAHKGDMMGEDIKKYLFYESAAVAADAASVMVRRYGEACLKKAEGEQGAARKAELKQMGESLLWISENPARTFWEACQAILLYLLFLHVDSSYPAIALGRLDQNTWPFLKADLEAGRLTLEEAQELIDFFILKATSFYNPSHPFVIMMVGAGNTYQHTTIGGVDPETEEDATNPVTYMVLETLARLQIHDPTISLRTNRNTPEKLWECAIEATRRVGGLPLIQNDEIIIPSLVKNLGFSLRDARDYSLIGCQEIVGSGTDYPAPNGIHPPHASVHFGVILTIALNNGVNPFNGKDSGIRTGYLYEMKSIEEVKAAYKKIADYVFHWEITMHNYSEYLTMYLAPHAALSISIEGCMEKGMDCTAGGAKYNSYGGTATGLATIADSLAAIQYMVFDKKECTGKELYDAVMANWEGYETLRQKILTKVPHYGNNDPYADQYMKFAIDTYVGLCKRSRSVRSKICKPGLYGAADHVAQGYHMWATPDGRKTGQPTADAASPAQGRDHEGPTAIFSSTCCFDHSPFMDGVALNIKIHPSALSRQDGIDKLRDMTRTYFDDGGLEVQYNVVSSDVLRAAQEKPDEYRNLVVRIAGYSAYFVEMNKDLQNDIISRTENMVS